MDQSKSGFYSENRKEFWEERWQSQQTGWDIGYPSPAIVSFVKENFEPSSSILIPGCGNAYEAEYLSDKGFKNITLIDIAPKAVAILKEKFPKFSSIEIYNEDFFDFSKSNFDLVIEQTFFCAIPPSMRVNYAKKMMEILKENGEVVGLLFNREFEHEGPPFGGTAEEYVEIFSPYFDILKMEICKNSIPPRQGNELWIHLRKKK